MRRSTIRVEFKREDCWVGVFWRRSNHPIPGRGLAIDARLDVWVCLVPMLPIHFVSHPSDTT